MQIVGGNVHGHTRDTACHVGIPIYITLPYLWTSQILEPNQIQFNSKSPINPFKPIKIRSNFLYSLFNLLPEREREVNKFMASFSVTWRSSNGGKNLQDLQGCLSHTKSSRLSGISFKKNSVSYRLRNCCHVTCCNAQNLSNSSVLNKSPAVRSDSDEYLSSSSSFSLSVLDHGHKISPIKKRMEEDYNEKDFSRKLDQWVKDSVVEVINFFPPFFLFFFLEI